VRKFFAAGQRVRHRRRIPLVGRAARVCGKIENHSGSLLAVSDVSRPFYGGAEPIYDGWISDSRLLGSRVNWKLQINVRNIGVGNELRPLAAWPDDTIVQWTIKEPQRWSLTSMFSF
jgi:hypothetical protein